MEENETQGSCDMPGNVDKSFTVLLEKSGVGVLTWLSQLSI